MAAAIAALVLWKTAGDTVPDVEFVTLTGERIRLRDWRGDPVLVTFWATDCRPCLEEIPDLSELHRTYAGRGLHVIAVAMHYDPPNRVLAVAREARLPYRVALDPLGRIAQALGPVPGVPASFLVGPDGRLILRRLGKLRAEELRGTLEALLEKAQ
ncbi:TlpA family protein disulfide reductase [Candidatus Methylocalor cossyra]